jgi:hypothetical protein
VIRRIVRIGLWLGFLAGLAFGVRRALERRVEVSDAPGAAPSPPSAPPEPTAPWVEPADGACPASHPVKAKLSSKIFHLPGMANYERTSPDRCYLGPAEAEADGLRPAKR